MYNTNEVRRKQMYKTVYKLGRKRLNTQNARRQENMKVRNQSNELQDCMKLRKKEIKQKKCNNGNNKESMKASNQKQQCHK